MWVLASILASAVLAIQTEINRHYKVDGMVISFWRTLMAIVCLTPFTPFMNWPAGGLFYPVAILLGVSIFIGMGVVMNMSARGRGRISQLQMPIKVFLVFGLWLVVDHASWVTFSSDWQRIIGVSLSFALALGALQFMRKNDTSWRALLEIAPIGVMFAVIDVLIKYATMGEPALPTVFALCYVAMVSAWVCSASWLVANRKTRRKLRVKNAFKVSALIAASAFVAFTCINYSIMSAPNPAYVSILLLLTPFWISVIHWLRKVPDDASPLAGAALVASAMALIWATQLS